MIVGTILYFNVGYLLANFIWKNRDIGKYTIEYNDCYAHHMSIKKIHDNRLTCFLLWPITTITSKRNEEIKERGIIPIHWGKEEEGFFILLVSCFWIVGVIWNIFLVGCIVLIYSFIYSVVFFLKFCTYPIKNNRFKTPTKEIVSSILC